MLTEAYKAEYETTDITIEALMAKYDLTRDDIPGHENWIPFKQEPIQPPKKKRTSTARQKKTDKVLASIAEQTPIVEEPKEVVIPEVVQPTDIAIPTEATDAQTAKIEKFKGLALDYCVNFMERDAKFAEVKEFKDIVAIVDTLEKSYQKVDPNAGKPTINILIGNLVERFKDDC